MIWVLILILCRTVCCNITTIHLVPHSHCDAGWIKTTDQYYDDQVKDIITRTIAHTTIHGEKYNWVETIFMHMWWERDATEEQKIQLLALIKNGTWEIVMGGWVMSDEALPTYSAVIEEMTLGHTWLSTRLNVKPKRGFEIDPFGLSSVQARLYREMGFETHVIARIPSYEKDKYRKTKNLEFHWKDSSNPSKSLFTHVMWDTYSTPFPFQYWNPGLLNPSVTPKNIEELSQFLIGMAIDDRLPSFLNKEHIFFPFGSDFAYVCPDIIYGNMSLLVNYINEHYSSQYHIQYSTLTDYFDAIQSSTTEYPSLEDNSFFVYSDNDVSQWSGFYTSQPRLKIQARRGEHLSRMMEQIYTFAYLSPLGSHFYGNYQWIDFFQTLFVLRDKNGQLQHHDAITGTCKFSVTDFYCKELDDALEGAYETTKTLLSSLIISESIFKGHKNESFILTSDEFEETSIVVRNEDVFGVYVYNSLSWPRDQSMVTIHFTYENNDDIEVKVNDLYETVYPSQVISSERRSEKKEIMIQMKQFPPLGYQYIEISVKSAMIKKKKKKKKEGIEKLSNDFYDIYMDPETNRVSSILNKITVLKMNVSYEFMYYPSYYSLDPLEQSSGAYIFRPQHSTPSPVSSAPSTIDLIVDNELVTEIHQTHCEYIKTIMRLYKGDGSRTNDYTKQESFFEFEFTQLGPIPDGYEVIMRWKTEIQNSQTLYHDELAYEMKRKEFVNVEKKEPVAANFYPMQYSGFIRSEESNQNGDDVYQFTVLSSKSQGVSSQANGEIEMMIHRTTVMDDMRGVFQPLLDPYVITRKDGFKMRFVLDTVKRSEKIWKFAAYDLNYGPEVFLMCPSLWNLQSYPKDFAQTFTFLSPNNGHHKDKDDIERNKKTNFVPDNLHLVTLAPVDQDYNRNEFVCRWLNIYESGESAAIDVSHIFLATPSKMTKTSLSLLHDEPGESKKDDNSVLYLESLEFATYKVVFSPYFSKN